MEIKTVKRMDVRRTSTRLHSSKEPWPVKPTMPVVAGSNPVRPVMVCSSAVRAQVLLFKVQASKVEGGKAELVQGSKRKGSKAHLEAKAERTSFDKFVSSFSSELRRLPIRGRIF